MPDLFEENRQETANVNAHAATPEAFPALVLNADFRPLSYYPLSLWSWQETVKAVFLDRVNIVSEYDRFVRSPTFEMRLPSVVSLKTYVKPALYPAFTRFNVFLRDRFTCQYCGAKDDLTFDHLIPRSRGGHDPLGQRRRRLRAVQPAQGRPAARRRSACGRSSSPTGPRCSSCTATGGCSRRTTCTKLARLSLLGHRARAVTLVGAIRYAIAPYAKTSWPSRRVQ